MLPLVFADLEDRHDARMIEIGRGLGFGMEPFDVGRRSQLARENHLHRDDAIERHLPGLEHHAHAAAGDLFQQLVVAKIAERADLAVGRGADSSDSASDRSPIRSSAAARRERPADGNERFQPVGFDFGESAGVVARLRDFLPAGDDKISRSGLIRGPARAAIRRPCRADNLRSSAASRRSKLPRRHRRAGRYAERLSSDKVGSRMGRFAGHVDSACSQILRISFSFRSIVRKARFNRSAICSFVKSFQLGDGDRPLIVIQQAEQPLVFLGDLSGKFRETARCRSIARRPADCRRNRAVR